MSYQCKDDNNCYMYFELRDINPLVDIKSFEHYIIQTIKILSIIYSKFLYVTDMLEHVSSAFVYNITKELKQNDHFIINIFIQNKINRADVFNTLPFQFTTKTFLQHLVPIYFDFYDYYQKFHSAQTNSSEYFVNQNNLETKNNYNNIKPTYTIVNNNNINNINIMISTSESKINIAPNFNTQNIVTNPINYTNHDMESKFEKHSHQKSDTISSDDKYVNEHPDQITPPDGWERFLYSQKQIEEKYQRIKELEFQLQNPMYIINFQKQILANFKHLIIYQRDANCNYKFPKCPKCSKKYIADQEQIKTTIS